VRPKKYRRTRNTELDKAVRNLDELQAFQDFKELILPVLRQDLDKGMTAEEILEKYTAIAAARIVSDMVKDTGSDAAKDILNRTRGKATERKEIRHRLESLPEDQVDALLLSKLKDVTDED
jgi:DNA-directed RNA polymerase specialized sigma24 family protein